MSKQQSKAKSNKKPQKSKKEKLADNKPFNKYLLNAGIFLGIILSAYLFYMPTKDYNLVYCDDNIFVLDMASFNKDPKNIDVAFNTTVGASYYRPLLTASFILDNQLGDGPNVETYRTTNLILHALGSGLIFLLFIILGFEWLPGLIFSLIFAFHPILTPAAAWISGRNDSMIALFLVPALISMIMYYKSENKIISNLFLILHFVLFAASLFTKEIAIMLPIVSLVFILLIHKEKLFSHRNIILAIGWVFISIIWFAMRQNAFSKITSPDEVGFGPFMKNLPTLPALFGKMFFPVKMIALSNFEAFSIVTGIIAILIITFLIYKTKSWTNPLVILGFAWFLFFLVPTFLVRIIYVDDFFDYAEHRAYLPMIGIFLILVQLIRNMKIDFHKPIFIGIAALVILIFGARAWFYKPIFSDRMSFWRHHIEVYPEKARGYLDLGKAYYVAGKLDSAEILYKEGIERNPQNFNLYIDLAAVYSKQKRYSESIAYAKRAIQLDPKNHLANYNLGKNYVLTGEHAKAIEPLERAIKRKANAVWMIDLAVAYYKTKQFDKSIETFKKSIAINPNNPLVYANMGSVYAIIQNYSEAEKIWLRALSLDDRMPDVYNNLIRLYILTGNQQKAFEFKQKLDNIGGELAKDIKINNPPN